MSLNVQAHLDVHYRCITTVFHLQKKQEDFVWASSFGILQNPEGLVLMPLISGGPGGMIFEINGIITGNRREENRLISISIAEQRLCVGRRGF